MITCRKQSFFFYIKSTVIVIGSHAIIVPKSIHVLVNVVPDEITVEDGKVEG